MSQQPLISGSEAPATEPGTTPSKVPGDSCKITASNLNFHYGKFQALNGISMQVYEKRVTVFMGGSGSGKSTLLRTMNRLNETVPNSRVEGELLLDGENVLQMDVGEVRKRVGMVFQKSNLFGKSIFENVAFGLRIHGYASQAAFLDTVKHSLRQVELWDEVKDNIHQSAYSLSAGQKQRLCLARALALNPEVLLLDEPCSALDPIATARFEDLISHLKDSCTIVIATHNTHQAARIADYAGFLVRGRLIEFDTAWTVFSKELPTD